MSLPQLFDLEPLFQTFESSDHGQWSDDLRMRTQRALAVDQHGLLSQWKSAWAALPNLTANSVGMDSGCVTATGVLSADEAELLKCGLKVFHPWRKGPFSLFGINIDTEWRSDWKWERLKDAVELRDRSVLDVGCGNGYFGWRMLAAGARLVAGLDPFLLYVMQHEVIKRYLGHELSNFVVPVGDDCIPERLHAFDVTFSMGVLYHRSAPIDHLQALHRTLKPGGQLVLESLIVDDERETVLTPEKRYAKMRNVWFLPSLSMLRLWLRRCAFRDVRVIDVTPTSTHEQRSTEWMTFESLPDFLDPADKSKTIEGYPAPVRAILTART